MLVFLIGLVFLITSLYFLRKYKLLEDRIEDRKNLKDAYETFFVIFLLASLVSIFGTGGTYVIQRKDFEEATKTIKVQEIYKIKATELTKTFSGYLAKKYPDFEKDIFDKIKPGDIPIYMVQYPELKSSETIMLLVEKINQLQNDMYDQQVEREQVLKRIRFRTRNIWWWNWIIPNYKMEAN